MRADAASYQDKNTILETKAENEKTKTSLDTISEKLQTSNDKSLKLQAACGRLDTRLVAQAEAIVRVNQQILEENNEYRVADAAKGELTREHGPARNGNKM